MSISGGSEAIDPKSRSEISSQDQKKGKTLNYRDHSLCGPTPADHFFTPHRSIVCPGASMYRLNKHYPCSFRWKRRMSAARLLKNGSRFQVRHNRLGRRRTDCLVCPRSPRRRHVQVAGVCLQFRRMGWASSRPSRLGR
jgi:hypothetical protein